MDAFSYLSVLLSIILGLAMTQILQGYRTILLARRRIDYDPLPVVWSVLVLLFATQAWWASFGLRDHSDWNFLGFTIVLLQMVLLYMMAGIILPDLAGERIDLAAHFEDHRRAFFGFMLAMLVTSIVKDALLNGSLPGSLNLLFHGLLMVTAIIGMGSSSRRVHYALAVCAAGGFAAYVALLFAKL
ncbi:MAG: hypothetical protein ABIW33_01005 [Sphingomicrobium sp.]